MEVAHFPNGKPGNHGYSTSFCIPQGIPIPRGSEVVTAVQPCDRDQLPLYDKLLPWLCGAPLEHHLATVAPAGLGAAEWRSPQCAATDGWRYLTFSLRVLLLEVAQFSTSKAKLLKWYLGYFLDGEILELGMVGRCGCSLL